MGVRSVSPGGLGVKDLIETYLYRGQFSENIPLRTLRTFSWGLKRCKTHLALDGLHPLFQHHSHLSPPSTCQMACIHRNYKYNLAIGHPQCPRWHTQVLYVEILRARDKDVQHHYPSVSSGVHKSVHEKNKIWLVVVHNHNWNPEDGAKKDLSHWIVWIVLHRISLRWALMDLFTLFLFLLFCPPYWCWLHLATAFVIKPWQNIVLAFSVGNLERPLFLTPLLEGFFRFPE